MPIPDKLPIARLEDEHTHYLGKCENGRLFWGYDTFVFTVPVTERSGNDWAKYRREYAVLYIFDNNGEFLEAKYLFAGLTSETNGDPLNEEIEVMIAALGEVTYQDIEVKPFQTVIDGFTFGLVVDEENETINLQPSSTISFQEPWDGEYYT